MEVWTEEENGDIGEPHSRGWKSLVLYKENAWKDTKKIPAHM